MQEKKIKNLFRNKKALALCLSCILIVTGAVCATTAYFVQKSEPVVNTFKIGDITYELNLFGNSPDGHTDAEITMPTINPDEDTEKDGAQSTVAAGSVDFTISQDPELTGYTFSGWYAEAVTSNKVYDPATSKITVGYNGPYTEYTNTQEDGPVVKLTLYAKWTPNTYKVIYKGNTNTGGEMQPSIHTYDVAKNLTENAYTKTGYTFTGWNTAADGSGTSYVDKQEVLNLTAVNGDEITLYAQWAANTYKVKYDGNGKTGGSMSPSEHVYDVEKALTENAYTRTGYTFAGWALSSDGKVKYSDKETVKNLTAEPNGEVTLYAQWTPNEYTVVYDKNGDDNAGITGSTANSTHTYDVAKNLTTNGYSRTGYTFIGWNTKADGSGDFYEDRESVMNLTAEPNGKVILYAQWGAKSYVLRYHANGGSGTMADQLIKYDEPTVLSKCTFTKADHSFMGWATTPNGEAKYIDEQIVVNLLESGTMDLYAVWAQDSHTVYFNYNGGSGSPASKQFQNGKPYGQLPEYPVHPTKVVSEKEVMSYLFTGWYTEPTGGTRVYASTIANTTEDHTLYAHWEEAPTNNVIKDIVVKNNPDDNFDGVVDDVYLNLKCSSSFEKFNIPLKNLVPGQKYKITYTASNDASFGDYINGYKNSVYGSYVVASKELTGGRIDLIGEYNKDYFGMDLLATWYDRIEPDGTHHDGSHAAINDEYLQGPFKNRTITFTATAKTMYWTWDFGLMQDGILDNYNITDIQLDPVVPEIKFGNKQLVIYTSSKAQVLNDNSSAYASNFVFDGDGYAETMYYPITGLTKDTTYTITFKHKMKGALINSDVYDYGCGISSVAPTKYNSKMEHDLGVTWISNTEVFKTYNGEEKTVTLTFKATGDTAYWVWNMANCSDSINCTIDIQVTNFKAKHNGGGEITYYPN